VEPVYLDYNATTPIDPAVLDAMLPFLGNPASGSLGNFGNPSSSHGYGKTTHSAIDRARSQVAALLGAHPDEIVFTSGGTEASNHAIKGTFFAKFATKPDSVRAHIVTTAIEHPATLKPCEFLRRLGCAITVLGVDRHGLVDPEAVRAALKPETILVSIMHANNEVGTVEPIADIAKIVKQHGALLHTDAAQSLGKIRVDVNDLGVDLLSVAGHKVYAPKGVGALFVRRGVKLEPLVHGAGHESGRRAGTENVPYIVGLGRACEKAAETLPATTAKLRGLRDRLWHLLHAALGERIVLNGHPERRLPNTLNVNFAGHVGAELLARAPQVAASTGSACHEGRIALSPVLAAMGVTPDVGQGAVRLSVGRFTTEAEIDRAAQLLIRAAQG
jgi:cysteine desulfurase